MPDSREPRLGFQETRENTGCAFVSLLCSDLFQEEDDLSDRMRDATSGMQSGRLANYVPCTPRTVGILDRLADLNPSTIAVMHGSSFAGDGASALRGLATTMRDVLG